MPYVLVTLDLDKKDEPKRAAFNDALAEKMWSDLTTTTTWQVAFKNSTTASDASEIILQDVEDAAAEAGIRYPIRLAFLFGPSSPVTATLNER